MKNFIILALLLILKQNYSFSQCVRGISTNHENPVNNEFNNFPPAQGLVNPWLNSLDLGENDGFGFTQIQLNPTADWDNSITTFLVKNPYDDLAVPGRPELSEYYDEFQNPIAYTERDFHWEDGWELMWLGTGYFPNGEKIDVENTERIKSAAGSLDHNRVPYVILYNKYRGVLRIFANVHSDLSFYSSSNLQFGYISSSTVSGIFRHADSYDRPLDKKTKISVVSSPHENPGNDNKWFSTDIQLGFDPCVCENLSNIEFLWKGFNTSTLEIYGRALGTTEPIVDSNGKLNVENEFLSNVEISSQNEKAGNIIYDRIDDLYDDYTTTLNKYKVALREYNSDESDFWITALSSAKDIITKDVPNLLGSEDAARFYSSSTGCITGACPTDINGIAKITKKASTIALSTGYNFLSASIKNKKPSKPVKPQSPTVNYTEMKFSGTITNEADQAYVGPFFTPGSFDPNDNFGSLGYFNYPAYNEPTGLFALLETPVLDFYSKEDQYEEIYTPVTIPNGGNPVVCKDIDLRRGWTDFSFKINQPLRYKFNDALDFDESKTDLKVAFVLTFDTKKVVDEDFETLIEFFDKEIKESNFRFLQYTEDGRELENYPRTPCSSTMYVTKDLVDETIKIVSPYYDIEYVNQVLFSGKLEVKTEMQNGINEFPFVEGTNNQIRHWPDEQNYKDIDLVKVEMKIIADMYFDQKGSDGEQINTFQTFTYLMYDQEENVDLISNYYTSPTFKTYVPNTISLSNEFIDANSEYVTSIQGNVLYIEAENIIISGELRVDPAYILVIKPGGGGGVFFFDGGELISDGTSGTIEIGEKNVMSTHINQE
ncbi:MAG: hypothetical protein RID18_12235, partial [Cytophagales bacterium]